MQTLLFNANLKHELGIKDKHLIAPSHIASEVYKARRNNRGFTFMSYSLSYKSIGLMYRLFREIKSEFIFQIFSKLVDYVCT